MVAPVFHGRLPDADNAIAAGRHVSVLRAVKRYPFPLPCIRLREMVWVAVPVVAIKLDHDARARDEGIDAELAAYEVLRGIDDAEAIEHSIAGPLKPVNFADCLLRVHHGQPLAVLRIGVSAVDGAVCWIAPLATGRGPRKAYPANFAGEPIPASSLPLIGVSHSAEVNGSAPAFGQADRHITNGTFCSDLMSRPILVGTGARACCLSPASSVWLRPKQSAANDANLRRAARGNALAFAATELGRCGPSRTPMERFSTLPARHFHRVNIARLYRKIQFGGEAA